MVRRMKLALLVVVGAIFSIAVAGTVWTSTSCSYSPKQLGSTQTSPVEGNRQTVLVELFTSEGCSSCPPADRQLAFMQQNQTSRTAEIVTLAYHVDYWDRLGWKDRFSSAAYSDRQNSYSAALNLDSSYTPQMIVDGRTQFVGSDSRKADRAVEDASGVAKGKVTVTTVAGQLNIVVNELPEHEAAEVLLAVAEDHLETDIKAGENGGQKLTHAAVVRDLRKIGEIAAGERKFATSTSTASKIDWKSENLRFVVFVQEQKGKRVIAVGSVTATGE